MYYRCITKNRGTDYYNILLVYDDDVLSCSHDEKAVIAGIEETFETKNDVIAEQKVYLGGNIEKFQLPNGKYEWSITSNSYVQGSINCAKAYFRGC